MENGKVGHLIEDLIRCHIMTERIKSDATMTSDEKENDIKVWDERRAEIRLRLDDKLNTL
jgi:hypothetical protein